MDVVDLWDPIVADCAGYTPRRAVLVQGPSPRRAEGRRVYDGGAAAPSSAGVEDAGICRNRGMIVATSSRDCSL